MLLLVRDVVAFPALLACNVLAVLVAGPGPLRKAGAVALAGLGFVVAAAFPPPAPAARGWLWLAGAMMWMRVVDVLGIVRANEPLGMNARPDRTPEPPTPLPAPPADAPRSGCPPALPPPADAVARLTQLLLVYDPRDMRPARPRLAVDLVAKAVVYGLLAATALLLASGAPLALRWLAGGVFFYALLEAVDGALRAFYAAAGLQAPPLQDHPILSRSLAELWGRRWNREVGRWIYRTCFAPLARRGRPALGVLAGFGWSAVFHGAAAWAATDVTMGAIMASFFLVHGGAVIAERRLGVMCWPPWVGRAWVIGVFGVSLPLFAEPMLRLMGV